MRMILNLYNPDHKNRDYNAYFMTDVRKELGKLFQCPVVVRTAVVIMSEDFPILQYTSPR